MGRVVRGGSISNHQLPKFPGEAHSEGNQVILRIPIYSLSGVSAGRFQQQSDQHGQFFVLEQP